MPRATDGTYTLPPGTLVNSGDTILPSQHNPAMNDLGQSMGNSLSRDGFGGMRAPLAMGGFQVQNVGAGSLDTDVATVAQTKANGVPIGTPLPWLTAVAPTGYLLAFGQAISRTTYADLFALYGTTFGSGDGLTTFNMPDFRGATFIGRDDMGGTALGRVTAATALATVIGAQSVALTIPQMPSHDHGGATGSNGAHTHNVDYFLGSPVGAQPGVAVDSGTRGAGVATSSAGSHNHTIAAQGSGESHPNVQPSFVVNIIIKVI